ncbi:LOW QUALITY PROTEIN: regulator of G-protein signaling 14 [Xiphophorus hellerii]|uniref:LOW QUALITY PROTEIN: regulator of G-protein signaling 14 n=1 Tax=Xiphophorus hellerii TaxID=8084 RepID=UPI0013B45957|nr:LOW QUALITY PROTEIN: regulator of G-protein signaling 14-like [Xiphophorus hellerii]
MAKNCNSLGIPLAHMSQAVSDGELNMTARGCGGSSSSLPGTPGGDVNSANSVLSWAVSFEKLLEDPHGVCYFTAFLKSEVSAENILFWQECEKFRKIPATSLDQLKAAARSIYGTYLSDSAPYSVNIDDTAKTEEKDLEKPTPDMFNKAQAQIFKLMKMDSYRRFVRSPLYQRCSLASVEGKHLPQLSTEPVRMGSWDDMANKSPTSDKKNRKSDSNSLPSGTSVSEKQRQKRGSWGDASNGSGPLKQSNMSIKSTSSVELGSLCRQMENGRPGPTSRDQAAGIGSRMGVEGGYCCVYLPDGSASLAPTRNGQPIKDMLASLCEKRGFPLKDVMIYLHGKDKPLSLDQDCSVLRDQQVSLELRVTFALENAFTGKTVGIMVKSSKTLQDALCSVMQKHHLKPQETAVTMVGSDEPVNLNCSVFRLANKTLRLEKAKGKEQTIIPRGGSSSPTAQAGSGSGGLEPRSSTQTDRVRTQQRPSKNRDMDGFLDMLTRAQCCRVDDQRGLLTKEQLEIPSFLQLSSDQGQNTDDSSVTSSSTTDSKTESGDNADAPAPAPASAPAPAPASAPAPANKSEESSDAPKSESKDLRETTV